ncbi:T9SS type A sorting domain-containing protein [Haliscomenobacter hydrossis]|uniref:Secretion system C-terminal sorting domain-containing protein n=1 Tax=Haliscomenobacter hydrossis (strain ATCC 27775 / DSM 1100 / LMG 10767 / O) TaxID=760192 RepID=F4KYI0_HALH1|nr:T9SS type A sorting domain-containing protein [Haliscomenobacter hydrossis]AEE49421.1 hypothetical protein Halhy_1529 [Haliscomenobacter hydrossis DSM 1100]
MKKTYLLLIASIWGCSLFGQETITLHWQITNDRNEPLAGVSIWKKQTTEGTTTDENGMFSIGVVEGRDELEISYLGFQNSSIPIRKGMKIKGTEILLPVDYDLPEVIITAYGRKRICGRPACQFGYIMPITKIDSVVNVNYESPKVRLFPTPTNHTVFLQQEISLGQIDLYNLSGQKLQSFSFSDQLNASINLSALPSGTYLLRSSNGWVEKVILQKQ